MRRILVIMGCGTKSLDSPYLVLKTTGILIYSNDREKKMMIGNKYASGYIEFSSQGLRVSALF